MAPRWFSDRSPRRSYAPLDNEDTKSEASIPFLEESATRPAPRRTWLGIVYLTIGLLIGVAGTAGYVRYASHNSEIYHSPIPDFPYEIRRFTHDSIFAQHSSPESDAAWHTLEGPIFPTVENTQRGYIRVDGSRRWDGLEPGWPMPDGTQKYGISMSHQIHCLGAVRKVAFELLEGSLNVTEFMATDLDAHSPSFVPSSFGIWHLTHCFDYIRQALQCAGDMAVEWPTDFNGHSLIVGWDIPHKCKAWDGIQKFMTQNA